MDSSNTDVDVYGLVTELCKRILDENTSEEHPYLPRKDNSGVLRKLRVRAFEILLKKSPKYYDEYECRNSDPAVDILKYAFVLKTGLRKWSRGEELERTLDRITEREKDFGDGVYSTLQFLNCLKSLEIKDKNALDIFHYGRPNPLLPEMPQNPKEVPRFQIYPIESLATPEKFEAMLGIQRNCLTVGDNDRDHRSCLSFGSHLKSTATIGVVESLGSRSILSVPMYTFQPVSTRDFSMASYFMPGITEDTNELRDEYSTGFIGEIPSRETQWLCVKPARAKLETASEISDVQSIDIDFNENSERAKKNWPDVDWEKIADFPDVPDHRTWEFLGHFEAPKELPFVTETSASMLHFETMKHASFLPLLPRHIVESLNPITEVPTRDFLENIKLLLLGVESETFTWDEKAGRFSLRRNTTIPGLSARALRSACDDVTHWGGCYRSLLVLTTPDARTGKMHQEGLIFRAMCNSVKDLLVFHQAAILRIPVGNIDANDSSFAVSSSALLGLLTRVKPAGTMIAEVARLCRCDRVNGNELGEGLGLLSQIYEEVTRITNPTIALVFYSTLKSCCEVYFRLLDQWIFEGNCDDVYGEFMIRSRPQFLRERSHRFWTKGFAINANSVPGFLVDLAESILECGKTVRLLKICDPKNPICAIFANSHPTLRVCLSVKMVREQEILGREYLLKGEKILGSNISFSVAFEEQRIAEREKAERVVEAQRETLMRIKREREEAKKNVARGKRELLAQLKDQAEEVATRKERERAAELMNDKRLLDDMNAAEVIAKSAELAEKMNVLNYYNELGAEVERRRLRADWRIRRAKLFHQRVDCINRANAELWGIESSDFAEFSRTTKTSPISTKIADELDNSAEEISAGPEAKIEEAEAASAEDENKNSALPDRQEFGETNAETARKPEAATKIAEVAKKPEAEPKIVEIERKPEAEAKIAEVTTKPEAETQIAEIARKSEAAPKIAEVARKPEAAPKIAEVTRKPEAVPKKSPRPCQLDINRTRMMSGSNFGNLNETAEIVNGNNFGVSQTLPADLRLIAEDNARAARENRTKMLREEYGMTPNNNEFNIIVMDAQGNENTICIDVATVNPDNLRKTVVMAENLEEANRNFTDAQRNRRRNTETAENLDDGNQNLKDGNENLTAAQRNRQRNSRRTPETPENLDEGNENFTAAQRNRRRNPETPENLDDGNENNFTAAQRNRRRNMEHTYCDAAPVAASRLNSADSSELQRNRARVMGLDRRNYRDYVDESEFGIVADFPDLPDLPVTRDHQDEGVTPMSCTTDTFPLSMSSSFTTQFPPDDFANREMQNATTPGDLTSDDPLDSRPVTGFDLPPSIGQTFPNFFGRGIATPNYESRLTVADVEMLDNTSLAVYLEKSVTIPLRIQSRLANAALVKFMIHEQKMLQHLHSLRSFFFLLNGEFAKSLTGSLYKQLYEISTPIELFRPASLTNILDNALNVAVGGNSCDNSRLLSLSVMDIPSQLQVSNPEFLDCLCLNYKISWPLNIVLDVNVMQQYSKVFKFLLMVGRVLYVLREDFHLLKIERNAAISAQYNRLQLYRHSMMQFITALHNYLAFSVLNASWAELEKDLEKATTLDQIYMTHVNYVKKILSRCMLTTRGEKMRTFLCNIFRVILKFHNRVRSQNWSGPDGAGYSRANFERLEKMYHTFCEARTYLAHVANKFATSGYQPHLTQFLNALNINPLYDLTAGSKKS